MTDVTENKTDGATQASLDRKSIDQCTKGLVEKFKSPVQGIDVSSFFDKSKAKIENKILNYFY